MSRISSFVDCSGDAQETQECTLKVARNLMQDSTYPRDSLAKFAVGGDSLCIDWQCFLNQLIRPGEKVVAAENSLESCRLAVLNIVEGRRGRSNHAIAVIRCSKTGSLLCLAGHAPPSMLHHFQEKKIMAAIVPCEWSESPPKIDVDLIDLT